MKIELTIEQITGMRIYICSLIFILVYALYRQFIRTSKQDQLITYVNGRLTDSGIFNWARIYRRLREKGVEFYHPQICKPHYYILMHLSCGLIGFFFFQLVAPAFSFIGMFLGLFLPTLYFNMVDKKDNEALINDAMTISNVLSLQLKGGAYVGVALAECREIVYHKRMRKALDELDNHLKTQDMTLAESIDELQSKFDSTEVLTVCLILKQGMETGRMTECSADLSRQCSASKQQIFERKKARLERALTYVMLLIFGSGMGFLIYRFLSAFTTSISNM